MLAYVTDRGLDSLELICSKLSGRVFSMPDLVCDEVLQTVRKNNQVEFYHVNDDFSVDWGTVSNPDVLFVIDYFGKEQELEVYPSLVIRDGVWFPSITKPLSPNEIWFNSYRKIVRKAKGSLIQSSIDLGREQRTINLEIQIDWSIRHSNFDALKKVLRDYSINFVPKYPSLFPVRLANREEVLDKLGRKGIKLPGMWKNYSRIPHPLYKELTFIPVDSRFVPKHMVEIGEKIKSVAKPVG